LAAAFDYRQAEEIRDAFARHGVRYLFIGKSGAILLGASNGSTTRGDVGSKSKDFRSVIPTTSLPVKKQQTA
jgi:hypothetical protein